jgi:hypothetical protein
VAIDFSQQTCALRFRLTCNSQAAFDSAVALLATERCAAPAQPPETIQHALSAFHCLIESCERPSPIAHRIQSRPQTGHRSQALSKLTRASCETSECADTTAIVKPGLVNRFANALVEQLAAVDSVRVM